MPPVYPTRVLTTPGSCAKVTSGCQNQPSAKVATSVCPIALVLEVCEEEEEETFWLMKESRDALTKVRLRVRGNLVDARLAKEASGFETTVARASFEL